MDGTFFFLMSGGPPTGVNVAPLGLAMSAVNPPAPPPQDAMAPVAVEVPVAPGEGVTAPAEVATPKCLGFQVKV